MSAGVAFERISCVGNVKYIRGMQTKRTQCKKALSHGNQWQMCWQKAGGAGGGPTHTPLATDCSGQRQNRSVTFQKKQTFGGSCSPPPLRQGEQKNV